MTIITPKIRGASASQIFGGQATRSRSYKFKFTDGTLMASGLAKFKFLDKIHIFELYRIVGPDTKKMLLIINEL